MARRDKDGRRRGGCAFCGAKMALQPITDALHLIHGPMLCFGHNMLSRPTRSSGSRLHVLDISTALTERDIVFGGEARLVRAIEAVVARHHPAAVFVYQTCVPSLIGDDLVAACREAASRVACPVIPVPLSGLSGGKDDGTDAAGEVLLNHVIGTREPERRTDTDMVLIGEYNVAGEVEHIRPLLAGLGIRLLASIPGDGRFAEIAGAHRARAAIALCSRAMGTLPEALRDRHGIPFIRGSFYGAANVSRTLRDIAALLVRQGGPADLVPRTEALIRREEDRVAVALAPLVPILAGKRALLGCGGVKAWSLAGTLRQLGLEVVGSSVLKCSDEERGRAAALVGAEHLIEERGVPETLDSGQVDVVLSGGMTRVEVIRAGIAWVEVNHERLLALSGYDGTIRLAEAIAAALDHPLRRSLAAAPPWEREMEAKILPFPHRRRS